MPNESNSANLESTIPHQFDSTNIYRLTFEHVAVGLAIGDLDGKFITVNQRMCEILGYQRDELMSLSLQELTLSEDFAERLAWSKEVLAGREQGSFKKIKRYRHKAGHLVWCKLTATLIRDNKSEPSHFVFSLQDMTELKDTELALDASLLKLRDAYNDLDKLASFDQLTGALKLSSMQNHLNFAIEQYRRHNTSASLIFIDIDGLAETNNRYGHSVGDRAMRKLADNLMDQARINDSVGRYKDDDFIVLLPNTRFREALDYFNRVGNPLEVNLASGGNISISLNLGICQINDEIESVADWINEAEAIMHEQRAKKNQPD